MSIVNSSKEPLVTLEDLIKIYTAVKEQYKVYKEGDHSKNKTLLYGLIAVAVFSLFAANGSISSLNKFVLTLSIPFTLLSYYWWYLTDAIAFQIINSCDWLILFVQALVDKSKHATIAPEEPLLKKIDNSIEAYKAYETLSNNLSWINLGTVILSALMVVLGIFWANFQSPVLLQQIDNKEYRVVFYGVLFLIIITIVLSQFFYNSFSKKYRVNATKCE